jgi:hypothetical protein
MLDAIDREIKAKSHLSPQKQREAALGLAIADRYRALSADYSELDPRLSGTDWRPAVEKLQLLKQELKYIKASHNWEPQTFVNEMATAALKKVRRGSQGRRSAQVPPVVSESRLAEIRMEANLLREAELEQDVVTDDVQEVA